MPDYIGNIEVPEITAGGVFPIDSDYGYGRSHRPEVAIHRFGSANAKIEQRFLLGMGAKRFTVRRSRMNEYDRALLRDFWENHYGPYGAFTYNAPNDDGNGATPFTCRFANEPLSFEFLSDAVSNVGITLVEIPTTSLSHTLNQTVTRFPSPALESALLSQVQEIIPLIKMQVRAAGYPAIYVSDRRCSVGSQLYLARLMEFDGIQQSIENDADQARFVFGNADRVMRMLANDTDLFRAAIEFSLFHVGTGIKLDLWKGEIVDWNLDGGPEFPVTAADGIYELTLPYPVRRICRTCWKAFNDGLGCPFATESSGMDYFHFPDADPGVCDKGYDTANGCLAHGMKHYFGGILAEPQGVRIKDNSQGTWGFGRPTVTSVSLLSDSIYDQIIPEIYTDNESHKDSAGLTKWGRLVNCKIAAGRDESDFYEALGIVGEGPITFQTSEHLLDGQYHHGPGIMGLRLYQGSDPAGPTDFFSLDEIGDDTGGDWRKVHSGHSIYKDNFAAGTAFAVIRRKDEKGIQLGLASGHEMQATVLYGLRGWIWTAPGVRSEQVLTNPVWIVINMMLKARGLRFAGTSVAEQYFDVDPAIAAAAVCDLSVEKLLGGPGNETQFKFQGVLSEEKPLRDWIQEVLMNCLGHYSFAFGKLKLGIRTNSGAAESFTEGNVLFQSLQLAPAKPAFNHLTANFGDAEFNFAANSVIIYDIDQAKLIGGSAAPLFLKSQMNLAGVSGKSQAARIITTRLREELGGITPAQWKAARQIAFKTTVLALSVEPGMICSMTHPDMPDGVLNGDPEPHYGEFRVVGWKLNKDYSIDIQGRTTVDEMYNLVTGPKPADVEASPVPVETIYGTHVPDDLYATGIDPQGRIIIGITAWKWNDTIFEAEFRAKFYATETPEHVDLRTPAEGGTLVHNGTTELIFYGYAAGPNGASLQFVSTVKGRCYFAGRLKNDCGWSVWSDGNDMPSRVKHYVDTEGSIGADGGPPEDSDVAATLVNGAVVVEAGRPAINGKTILTCTVQLRDANAGGSWRDLDANAGAAVTHYDGSGVDHVYNQKTGTITKAAGDWGSAAPGSLLLFDVRNAGQFDVQNCVWAMVGEIDGLTLKGLTGLRVTADADENDHIWNHIRIKIVRPPWEWDSEGYLGATPSRGYWQGQYYWGGSQGNKTSVLFISAPISLPDNLVLGNIVARVFFENKICIAECGQANAAALVDTGNPSGASRLEIITHENDPLVPSGQMALRWNRDTVNYKNIFAAAFWLSTALPAEGPYKVERDAHETCVLESGSCTITAGETSVVVTRAGNPAIVDRVLLIFTDDATPDSDLDGNLIQAQGTDSITLYTPFNKSGTFHYAIIKRFWDRVTPDTGNLAYHQFAVPADIGGDVEKAVWQTPPISMPDGTFYVTGCGRNPFGLGARMTAYSEETQEGTGYCIIVPEADPIVLNCSQVNGNGKVFRLVLTADRTLQAVNALCGQPIALLVEQGAGGGHALNLDTMFRFGDDLPAAMWSGAVGKVDYLGVIYYEPDQRYDVVALMRGYGP